MSWLTSLLHRPHVGWWDLIDILVVSILLYEVFTLIRGTRAKMFFPEITRLSNTLLADEDDMVQKGLGWLLRETAKYDARRTVPYLMKIRALAPRLVLRTACETLPAEIKKRVLAPEKCNLQK